MGVPHTEETLALLVNVHFVGGSKDLTQHLRGLTLRVHVIQRLIDILRASGYPGYEPDGINSADKVARRLHDRYRQHYGDATFTPAAVLEAARVHKNTALSLVQDKVATPPEALQSIEGWQRTTRPSHIVAERSVQSQSNIHENYAAVFGKYGDFNITTASTMTKQFVPWYLGMAFPFTMPSAVGGYDVPDHPRWCRPEDEDLPFPRACMDVWTQTQKAYVFLIFCLKMFLPGKTLCATKTSKVVLTVGGQALRIPGTFLSQAKCYAPRKLVKLFLYLWLSGTIPTWHTSIPCKTLCATKTSKVVIVALPVVVLFCSARCCIIFLPAILSYLTGCCFFYYLYVLQGCFHHRKTFGMHKILFRHSRHHRIWRLPSAFQIATPQWGQHAQ